MLSTQEALKRLLDSAPFISGTESIKTHHANGRVLAETLSSRINVPNVDSSVMDGYAVRTEDCKGGKAVLVVGQHIPAGNVGRPLHKGEAARIFTGAPIPEGADAVVMQEFCKANNDKGTVTIMHVPKPGDWIRQTGENVRKEDVVLEKGTPLRPQHLGLAASVGFLDLAVVRRPRVAFLSTGNEVVMPGEYLRPGHVYNSNRYLVRGLLEELGCVFTDFGNVADDPETIGKVLRDMTDRSDLILTSGGMSVGEEDFVRAAVESLGEIRLWQIAVKPGKPLAYGSINAAGGDAIPFIGMPGNPVSTFVTFLVFVRPFILRMMGVEDVTPRSLMVRADFAMKVPEDRNEFLRARINGKNGLDLYENQGSGALASITWGDGLIDNPPGNTIKKGDMVRFFPFNNLIHP